MTNNTEQRESREAEAPPDERIGPLLDGFESRILTAQENRDDYGVGYLNVMRDMFVELMNDRDTASRALVADLAAARAEVAALKVPLSDEQILIEWTGDKLLGRPVMGRNKVIAFGRAIEAAHGITARRNEVAAPAGGEVRPRVIARIMHDKLGHPYAAMNTAYDDQGNGLAVGTELFLAPTPTKSDALDAARLEWMIFYSARVHHTNDAEYCSVQYQVDREWQSTELFGDARAAIDAAMLAANQEKRS